MDLSAKFFQNFAWTTEAVGTYLAEKNQQLIWLYAQV